LYCANYCQSMKSSVVTPLTVLWKTITAKARRTVCGLLGQELSALGLALYDIQSGDDAFWLYLIPEDDVAEFEVYSKKGKLYSEEYGEKFKAIRLKQPRKKSDSRQNVLSRCSYSIRNFSSWQRHTYQF